MENREHAMKWWNNLSSLRKTQICDTNTQLVGSVRRWETLTGREIENIFVSGYINECNFIEIGDNIELYNGTKGIVLDLYKSINKFEIKHIDGYGEPIHIMNIKTINGRLIDCQNLIFNI